MAEKQPVAERNLDGYGAPPIPWARVRERLETGFPQVPGAGGPDRHTCWLATVNPDGRPHVVPLGVVVVEGVLLGLTMTDVIRSFRHVCRASPRAHASWMASGSQRSVRAGEGR